MVILFKGMLTKLEHVLVKKKKMVVGLFTFEYDTSKNNITIEKGSVTVNGVSLTVVNSKKNQFSVAIIPYTYAHTNFRKIQKGM